MQVILDGLNNRDAVGLAIKAMFAKGGRQARIIAPYFSETDKYIDFSKIGKLRIICDARNPSCNPNTLLDLRKRHKSVSIRSRADIHAKVYCVDNQAVVTSANPTPNGLGVGKLEAGVIVDIDPDDSGSMDWFDSLWDAEDTENVDEYDDETWDQLKAIWDISQSKNPGNKQLPTLSNYIIAQAIPDNMYFAFWVEADECPEKEDISDQAQSEIPGLPDSLNEWDYWIEEGNYNAKKNKKHLALKNFINSNRDYIFIAIKVLPNDNADENENEHFLFKTLGTIVVQNSNGTNQLLSIYKKIDNTIFQIDKTCIKMLNTSLKKKSVQWKTLRTGNVGCEYEFFSLKQIYSLVP